MGEGMELEVLGVVVALEKSTRGAGARKKSDSAVYTPGQVVPETCPWCGGSFWNIYYHVSHHCKVVRKINDYTKSCRDR